LGGFFALCSSDGLDDFRWLGEDARTDTQQPEGTMSHKDQELQELSDEASRCEFAALLVAVGVCAALLPGALLLADWIAAALGFGPL
jgi:hypothetical protein